jgi:hypothetical protein
MRSLSTIRSYPNAIKPSTIEIQNGQLGPKNLEIAIRSLYHDGLVVVNDVVPHDMLDRLNEKMIQDAHTLFARKENSPFNYNPNNIQQDAPPMLKYFESQIFMSLSPSIQPPDRYKDTDTAKIRSQSKSHQPHWVPDQNGHSVPETRPCLLLQNIHLLHSLCTLMRTFNTLITHSLWSSMSH